MRDIKKRFTNSKSSHHSSRLQDLRSTRGGSVHAEIPTKKHTVDIDKKFEDFEKSRPAGEKNIVHKAKNKNVSKGNNNILYALGLLIVVIALLVTFVFNKATVTIVPRVENFDARESLVLTNNLQKNFEIVELSKSATKQIPKSESKKVATKASGKIVIYNTYSDAPQKLIKNTRFETKDGKIFRTTESITIPGKTASGPGTVTAQVFADAIGSDYNIAPTTFTIPGFKNTARYTGFSAESKEYMQGGGSGNVDTVASEDIDLARADLESKLKAEIEKEVKNINKDGFIGVFTNISYDVQDNKSQLIAGAASEYDISLSSKTLFVRKSAVSSALAYKQIKGFNGEAVRIQDFASLAISLSPDASLLATSSVAIMVEGKSSIVYQVDPMDLKQNLVSKSKSEFVDILKPYKNEIYSAKSTMFPAWIQAFPSNSNKIRIEESLQ